MAEGKRGIAWPEAYATASWYFIQQERAIQIAGLLKIGRTLAKDLAKASDGVGYLTEEFNTMAARLQEAYAGLEREVAERTRELKQSLEEQQALTEIIQAVNSSLDLHQILTTIAEDAASLSKSDMAAIVEFDETLQEFRITATYQMSDSLVEAFHGVPESSGLQRLRRKRRAGGDHGTPPGVPSGDGEAHLPVEGTLEGFTRDGIMVFFNDPLPCEDHAEKAVRMAVAMRAGGRRFRSGGRKGV